jgi:hypothetical protein
VGGKGGSLSLHGCYPEALVVVVLDVQLEPTLFYTNPSLDLIAYNRHPPFTRVVHITPPPPHSLYVICIRHRVPNLFFHRTASAVGPIKSQLTKQLRACFNATSSHRHVCTTAPSPRFINYTHRKIKFSSDRTIRRLGGQLSQLSHDILHFYVFLETRIKRSSTASFMQLPCLIGS